MQSSREKEQRSYTRAALICFVCVIACLVFDIQKFCRAGRILFDVEFFVSVALYILLIFLGIRMLRKRKGKQDTG